MLLSPYQFGYITINTIFFENLDRFCQIFFQFDLYASIYGSSIKCINFIFRAGFFPSKRKNKLRLLKCKSNILFFLSTYSTTKNTHCYMFTVVWDWFYCRKMWHTLLIKQQKFLAVYKAIILFVVKYFWSHNIFKPSLSNFHCH
jgi:hypothetical protein